MSVLPYNPGLIPTKPCPNEGDIVEIFVEGLPPYKDMSQSIRNRKHKAYGRFIALRKAAIEVMGGRAWSFGNIELNIQVFGDKKQLDKSLTDYLAGIMDTLDGSSGTEFTFLPIAFEDDCQVSDSSIAFSESTEQAYRVRIVFGSKSNA